MKIGIFSDIHGNLPAFEAVLQVLDHLGCTKFLCAGDVVGYGPWPLECIQLVNDRKILSVQGNHDFWVASGGVNWGISPYAQAALQWTLEQLPKDAIAWLNRLPKKLEYGPISVVHASNALEPPWTYVLAERNLRANFVMQDSVYTFHGHTHVPLLGVHRRGERPKFFQLRSMELPPGARYLVNVGAVGQPRDRNPRAACGIFHTDTRHFQFLRVPYHIAWTQKRMREVGLPEPLINRLSIGR